MTTSHTPQPESDNTESTVDNVMNESSAIPDPPNPPSSDLPPPKGPALGGVVVGLLSVVVSGTIFILVATDIRWPAGTVFAAISIGLGTLLLIVGMYSVFASRK